MSNVDELQAKIDQLNDSLDAASRAAAASTVANEKATTATNKNTDATSKFERAAYQVAQSLSAMGSGASQFTKAMTSGKEGFSSMNGAIDGVTTAAGGLLGIFGKWGGAISGLINVLGGVAKAALELRDNQIKAAQAASEFGALDFTGVQGFIEDAKAAQFPSDKLEIFNKVLRENSVSLAQMGTTVGDGRRQLVDFFKLGVEQSQKELAQLGYNHEKQFEVYADYATNMARLGVVQTKSVKDLAAGSYEYAKNLKELAEITGTSVEEQKKRLEEQQNDLKFNLFIGQLIRDNKEDQARAIQNFVQLQQSLGTEQGKAARSLFAARGAIVDTTTAEINLATQGQLQGQVQAMLRGSSNWVEASRRVADGLLQGFQVNATNINVGAELVGQTAQSYAQAQKLSTLTAEKAAELERQFLQQRQENNDKNLADANTQAAQSRQLALTKDQVLGKVADGIIPALQRVQKAFNDFADWFSKKFEWLIGKTSDNQGSTRGTENQIGIIGAGNSRDKVAQMHAGNARTQASIAAAGTISSNVISARSGVDISNLNGDLKSRLLAMANDYSIASGGDHLIISSGHRDPQKQQQLYNSGRPVPGKIHRILPDGNPVLPPDHSMHTRGLAIDLPISQLNSLNKYKIVPEHYGFTRKKENTALHLEIPGARRGGVFVGPESGYRIEHHGREAILDQERTDKINNFVDSSLDTAGIANMISTSINAAVNTQIDALNSAFDLFASKMDDMISKMDDTNSIQSKVLTHVSNA